MDNTGEEPGIKELKTGTVSTAIPILNLNGSSYEMGLTHGKRFRLEIEHNLVIYRKRFQNETKLTREQVRFRAGKYLDAIEKYDSEYSVMMRGVAEGSGFDLTDIVALNVRYELMYSQYSKLGIPAKNKTDGCTAFAILPEMTVSGHILLAQNWDWIPEVHGVFLKIEDETGPSILCFTEAGVVGGKIGLNRDGLGMLINGLVSNVDDWSRLGKPFHVQCWEALRSRFLEEAVSVVSTGRRSCSANFIFGQQQKGDGEIVDVESAPEAANRLEATKGMIAHTNHFCNPSRVGVSQVIDDEWRSTLTRYNRITELLADQVERHEKFDIPGLQRILRDHHSHPDSICRHPDEQLPEDDRYKSVVSVIMDLHERKLWATNGSPCENEYELIGL